LATILTVLDALVQLEEGLRDLYIWLSELYADDAMASGTFYRLSLKEASHANRVKYQRRLVHQNADELRHIEVDVTEIRNILKEIRRFRTGAGSPRLREALDFAMDIERAAADRAHQPSVAHRDAAIDELMTSLSGDDRSHYEILKKLRDKTDSA